MDNNNMDLAHVFVIASLLSVWTKEEIFLDGEAWACLKLLKNVFLIPLDF